MLKSSLHLNPLLQYSWAWFFLGLLFIVLIIIWLVWVFLSTAKHPKTIRDLKMLSGGNELAKAKEKYLSMIDEYEKQYLSKKITFRELHRHLSSVIRHFVYSVNHFPAPRLTLNDMKKSPYPELAKLIDEYYVKEFDVIEHGKYLESIQAAKELINSWN